MGMQTMTIQIDANIAWGMKRLPSGGYIAVCDGLGLTVEAKDEPELRSMIEETLSILFLDIFSDGEMDQFLRSHGWMAKSPIPTEIQTGIENGVQFDVPFELRPWSRVNA
jgi:hypothetical protein